MRNRQKLGKRPESQTMNPCDMPLTPSVAPSVAPLKRTALLELQPSRTTSPRPPWQGLLLAAGCLLGAAPEAIAQTTPANPTLQIGIVQRFGDERGDRLTLTPPPGSQLSLQLKTDQGSQTYTTRDPVQVEVVPQPLPTPQVTERVVLSTHRSFESAEDSANYWRSQGLEIEIAQPQQWQVWAKRDTYRTPLLRRLALRNVQAQGGRTVFLDSQVQREIPQAGFVINGSRMVSEEVNITSSTGTLYVNETPQADQRRLFAGSFRLQPNAYGTYTLVNNVPTETYLRGVVPFEIGPGAPPPTIEAQAILARTYALRNLRRFAIDNYQLCADTQCQVYRGLSGAANSTDRAIAVTQSQVLTYQNELVDALYSSTTGGVTAAFSDVWNGPDRPYLRPRIDSVQNLWDLQARPLSEEANFRAFIRLEQGFNEVGWEPFRWDETSTLADLTTDIKAYLRSRQHPLANFQRVESLSVSERSAGGRVQKLVVMTDLGQVVLEKDEVLRALTPPRSTLFYIDPTYEMRPAPSPVPSPAAELAPSPSGDPAVPSEAASVPTPPTPSAVPSPPAMVQVLTGYRFVGGGWGHAVGLSQTGAMNLGELNWSAPRILSFYFPGASVVPLTDRITYWRDPASTQEIR